MDSGNPDSAEGRKATAGVMDHFKSNAEALRKPLDPAKMGLSEEEYEARRKEAFSKYKVKKERGTIEIDSSAKKQQVLTQGTAEKMIEKRRTDIKKRYTVFNRVRWTGATVCAGCFCLFVYEVMYPVTKLHWDRHERMKRRHEEVFLPAMRRLEEERMAAVAAGKAPELAESANQVFGRPPQSL